MLTDPAQAGPAQVYAAHADSARTDSAQTGPAQAVPALSDADADPAQGDLLRRVLSALLREDAYRLRSRATPVHRPDGDLLRLPLPGGQVLLPVGPDGHQCELAAREGLLETPDGPRRTLPEVLALLRTVVPAEDLPGFDAFAAECAEALAATRAYERQHPRVRAQLATAPRLGLPGSLTHDALAAAREHPVYPTARARTGLSTSQLRDYAPEFHPQFALNWLVLPAGAVRCATRPGLSRTPSAELFPGQGLPGWWPTPQSLGLPDCGPGHLALPVHPLTAGPALAAALREATLSGARLAGPARVRVRPTLSMRTVAVLDDPRTHLKLPLATATLGMRNRRTITPGSLVDGSAGQRLLTHLLARETRLTTRVLLADEHTHLSAGHDLLGVLVRRMPAGLDDAHVVSAAALLAPLPDGATVADDLAARYYGGDLPALLDAYLRLLLDLHTTLFGYGVALESHQQNTSLVLDAPAGRTRLRLLLKDNDSPRVHTGRLAARLGGGTAADLCGFADRRVLTGADLPIADLLTTITLHLCAAAPLFELARLGRAPLPDLLGRLRDLLSEAVDRLDGEPGGSAAILRARVLDADRLPVKAMLTAGTLLPKDRTRAADVNKYYVTGPNYIREKLP
ncbi:IucA/IucC family protein [Streptomyces sp. 549]|uniref:IucA/IucC family protein n=1 Tax=Streptomyces sp. 549 TaxID=3049076 RepID=UPI0024C42D13|nr:IucA/IucC family protein [Streptomyces sp. 549]MDK1475676.1 IucA/IucC family protein [Streptomyces sp. 549]